MAHERGTASSQDDFVTKLDAFMVANGWTQHRLDTTNDQAAWSKGGIHVQMEWDANDIGVWQSLSNSGGGVDAGNHADDSGNGGLTSSTRAMNDVGNGPYTSYDVYSGTENGKEYLYAALEFQPGFYRFFGAGDLDKIGDWTGGEYVATSVWVQTSVIGQPSSTDHSVLMDYGNGSAARGGTLHVRDLPEMDPADRWGVYTSGTSAGTDGNGETRAVIFGGMRGGPYTLSLGWMQSSLQQGFVPLIPVPAWHRRTGTTPDQVQLLGFHPGIRVVNMAAFEPADTFQVGSDTWQIFPMSHKGPPSGTIEKSGHGGIAFLR